MRGNRRGGGAPSEKRRVRERMRRRGSRRSQGCRSRLCSSWKEPARSRRQCHAGSHRTACSHGHLTVASRCAPRAQGENHGGPTRRERVSPQEALRASQTGEHMGALPLPLGTPAAHVLHWGLFLCPHVPLSRPGLIPFPFLHILLPGIFPAGPHLLPASFRRHETDLTPSGQAVEFPCGVLSPLALPRA